MLESLRTIARDTRGLALTEFAFAFVGITVSVGIVVWLTGKITEHAILVQVQYAVRIGVRSGLKIIRLVG